MIPLLLALLAPPPAAPAVTVVRGGELHLGDGTVLRDATVVIRDGKFAALGGPELAGQAGDVIDARGKIVTPGLIAADTQLGLVEIDLEGSTRDDSRAG